MAFGRRWGELNESQSLSNRYPDTDSSFQGCRTRHRSCRRGRCPGAAESGEFSELTYQLAIARTSPVETTLETGKSYVGIPVASRVAMKHEDDLWLVPLMSGYRDEQQELRITTNYAAKQDDELMAGRSLPLGDFVVALPKSRIVSARPFDVELFRAMFEHSKA